MQRGTDNRMEGKVIRLDFQKRFLFKDGFLSQQVTFPLTSCLEHILMTGTPAAIVEHEATLRVEAT